MAVALETFVKNLEDSGIISPSKLKVFLPPQAAPKDAQELARQLIQQKQLTKFQAQEIYQGRAKSLILGNYTILDKIGAGGMGQVFKAEHRRMHRVVAIKTLPTKMMKDPAAVARFEREVHAAAKLSHPNIVAAHDADEANGVYFLVMEYVEGADLSALVKKNGPFPVAKACNFILQAARGLEFAHKKGVVHRDIKPANLLLDNEGTVKILDMGLARIDAGDGAAQAELTGTGMVMGTVDYMAPEQATSTHHADARADIYSLGCSLHYLIVGKATYGGETVIEKLLAHRDKPIPQLRESQPEVSNDLQAIFEKMVAKTVEDRYQTMTEVVADLERLIAGQSTSFSGPKIVTTPDTGTVTFLKETPRPTTKKTKPALSPGKNRTLLIAGVAAAVVLLLAIVGGWIVFRGKPNPNPDGRVAKNDRPPPPPGKPTGKTPPKPPPGKSSVEPKQALATAKTNDFALEFDGKSIVTVENITWGPLKEFTFESFARADDAGGDGFVIDRYKNASITRYQGRWQMTVKYAGTTAPAYAGEKTTSAQVGQWYHLAGVVRDNTARLFIDGKLIEAKPLVNPLEAGLGNKLEFGKGFVGAIRGIRISSVARYDAEFAPPQKLSADSQTLALYDFADGAGNLLTDASGHRLHGQIAGAKWISLEDLDRQVAEWVLSKGRKVAVLQDGKSSPWISSATALPAGAFQLQKVDLSRLPAQLDILVPIRNEELANLSTLTNLESLSLALAGNIISDAGLIHLSSLKSLKDLKLDSLRDVTDAGMVHLAGLTELKNLTLSHTSVTGAGLSHLQDLKKLEWLDIVHVTDESVPTLLNFTQLTTLRFQQSSLTDNGVAKLAPLKKLKALGLDCPQITDEALKTILEFVDLNDLYLRFTAITDRGLIQLAKLSKLTRLVVTQSKVTPAGMAELQKLLPKCKIEWEDNIKPPPPGNAATTDTDRQVAEWAISKGGSVQVGQQGRSSSWINTAAGLPAPPYQVLRIDFPTFSKQPPAVTIDVRDDELSMLKGLRSLDYLNLSRTQITDTGLAHLASLTSLTGLELNSLPGVTDAGMAHLSELSELKKLTLSNSKVTGLGLQKLQKLKHLQWLDVDQVTDASLPAVAAFVQLTKFRATKSPVSDAGVAQLTSLKDLKTLHLSDSRLTDDGVKTISEMTQLTELAISSAGITDNGLDHLAKTSNLSRLVVTKTKVTAAGVARLQQALPKCKIEWDDPSKPTSPANQAPLTPVTAAQAAIPTAWTPRSMAEWTIRRGGKVWIGQQKDIFNVEDLPANVTYLTLVSMDGVRDLNDNDLSAIISWSERYDLSFGLNFSNSSLTDEGLRRLAAVKVRGSASFLNTQITGVGFDAWAGKPVGTLAIERSKVSPTGWQNVAQLGNFTQLYANLTSLDDKQLHEIVARHPELSFLDAEVTQLSDKAIDDLKSLKNLTYLNLGSTLISDASVPKLTEIQSLQTLKLRKTSITPAGIDALKKALPNCKIE